MLVHTPMALMLPETCLTDSHTVHNNYLYKPTYCFTSSNVFVLMG